MLGVAGPAIGIVLVIGALGLQIRGWRSGAIVVSPGQRGFRIASAALIVAILAMILAANEWPDMLSSPRVMVFFFATCMALASAVVILALLDIRELNKSWAEERKRILRELALSARSKDEKNGSHDSG